MGESQGSEQVTNNMRISDGYLGISNVKEARELTHAVTNSRSNYVVLEKKFKLRILISTI